MAQRFAVAAFTKNNFHKALSNDHMTADEAGARAMVQRLYGYLRELNATTIVEEPDYTDRDYLDDFTAYYAKCFAPYDRRCKRVHFFANSFKSRDFVQLVQEDARKDVLESFLRAYLGFIVVRPLPDALIGRTVLATYDADGGRRWYPCTKTYEANLFGLPLSVRSLAFQEQDTVLAACATVALWSSFHKTAELFGTQTPTPSKITESASRIIHMGRPVPSRGLDFLEMGNAVRQIGLEPEIFQVTRDLPLISLMYGYMNMGLPVVLGVEVDGIGGHAVAMTGYSLQAKPVRPTECTGNVPMVGLRIDKFYAHDDQMCPFTRVEIRPGGKVKDREYPVTFFGWSDPDGGGGRLMYPEVLLIPVYGKIRLTFIDVQQWITRIHKLLVLLLPSADGLEWDVALTKSNGYKGLIKKSESLDAESKSRLLFGHHPRFAWRAGLKNAKRATLIELLFDATDMTRSFSIYEVVWFHPTFKAWLSPILRDPTLHGPLEKVLTRKLLGLLQKSLG